MWVEGLVFVVKKGKMKFEDVLWNMDIGLLDV